MTPHEISNIKSKSNLCTIKIGICREGLSAEDIDMPLKCQISLNV